MSAPERPKPIRRMLGGIVTAAVALSLVGCVGTTYPPSVIEGSAVTVAWPDALSSLNVASAAGATAGNIEVEQVTRAQFARERMGKVEFDRDFGRIRIEEQSAESFMLSYDLAQPTWSDGIALDAADLMLAWAAGSNFFAPDGEDDAAPSDANPARFASVASGLRLSDEIPAYDEFERRIDVHFERPFFGWETALDVAVPAHIIGRHALGVEDPMAAKTAVIQAITGSDTRAIEKIAALWNSGFALGEDRIPRQEREISSGPYRIEKVDGAADDPAQRVTLVANAAYAAEPGARYERLILQRDAGQHPEADIGESYDVVQVDPRAENFASIRQLERDDYGVSDIDHGDAWMVFVNTAASRPLADPTARGVLMRSFDRDDLVTDAVGDWEGMYSSTASVLFAPGTAAYEVALEDSGFRAAFQGGGDPLKLRESAGVAAGIRLCVLYDRRSPIAAGLFESFRTQVAEGGWNATDCGSDAPEDAATGENWDVYLGRVPLPQEPSEIRAQWGTGGDRNITRSATSVRDDLITRLESTTDRYEARDLRVSIEQTIVDQMVAAPLAMEPVLVISDRDVEGVEPRSGRHGSLLERAIGWHPA